MSETKWTPARGDKVWAARTSWNGTQVEAESATVRAISAKQVTLTGSGSAFNFASRFDPSWLGKRLFPTREAALAGLAEKLAEAVREAQRQLAVAQAALAKARGEETKP